MNYIIKEINGELLNDMLCWSSEALVSVYQTNNCCIYFKLQSISYNEIQELALKLCGVWFIGTEFDWDWIETEKFPF